MAYSEDRKERIPVELPNGAILQVEVTPTGREDVSVGKHTFDEVTKTLEGLIESISDTLQKVKPDRASVKLGLKIAMESGQLTTLLVKGSSEADLEITLEWGKET